jgi:hypothetical protein
MRIMSNQATSADQATQFASSLVGKRHATLNRKSYRADCSGTVRAIYDSIGVSLGPSQTNDSAAIYEFVKSRGQLVKDNPRPGDIVFFDNTYDRNRDGKMNDALTHVGVVEKILDDGTIIFVHHLRNSIIRSRMSDMLRRTSSMGKGLSCSELFVSFGRI